MSIKDLSRLLLSDIEAAQLSYTEQGNQPSARNLIRAQFSAIDGFAWLLRDYVADIARQMDQLQSDEAMALSELSYSVTSSGKITHQKKFVPTLSAIRLSARIAKRINSELDIDFGDSGWEKLKAATEVRNRITHPKSPDDMRVTRDELSDCDTAFHWCVETILTIMEGALSAYREEVSGITEIYEELKANDPTAWADYQAALAEGIDD